MTRKYHPNTKLTDEDVEQIRQLIEWKKEEIIRINSIASCAAIAEKFDVSRRTIDNISNYTSHRPRAIGICYKTQTEQTNKNISAGKLAIDLSLAGEYTRRTGIEAIDVIREMAPTHTKTEVCKIFGWKNTDALTGWLKRRGYSVEFKKVKPVPPRTKSGWADLNLGFRKQQPKPSAVQNTL